MHSFFRLAGIRHKLFQEFFNHIDNTIDLDGTIKSNRVDRSP